MKLKRISWSEGPPGPPERPPGTGGEARQEKERSGSAAHGILLVFVRESTERANATLKVFFNPPSALVLHPWERGAHSARWAGGYPPRWGFGWAARRKVDREKRRGRQDAPRTTSTSGGRPARVETGSKSALLALYTTRLGWHLFEPLFIRQGNHRVDLRRLTRRHVTGHKRYTRQQDRDAHKRYRISSTNSVEQA